ncbi:LysE family transporter [Myceligenerans cantabricum]
MWPALAAGVVAGFAVALPVGAVATYLVGLAARTSWRVGAAGALGIATVDGGYALLAALFGTAVTSLVVPVETPLRIASALILVALALHGARTALSATQQQEDPAGSAHPRRPPRTPVLTPARSFARFVAITAVNPATLLFFAVVVAGGALLPDDGAGAGLALEPSGLRVAVTFGAAAFVASASWQLLLALGGTLLGRTLSGPRGTLVTALASSALMVVLAVVALLG